MRTIQPGRLSTALLALLGAGAAGAASIWMYRDGGTANPNAFLLASLSVSLLAGVWRGSRLSTAIFAAAIGIYLWWFVALMFDQGVVVLPSRTLPAAIAPRENWPVLFWLVAAVYSVLGAFMLWAAGSAYRQQHLFRR